jgi:hypothetical protein
MGATNHHSPARHLEGFLFPKGQSPMECKQHIRTILHQRTYMPGKKDRGNADGFLRFETNLRIIFEAVKHYASAWGHRDFWVRVRPCLDFHHNTAEHNLDEIVHRYCAGRSAFCDSLSPDQRQHSSQPPNRIAALADFVIGLPKESPYELSYNEWRDLESSWKSLLHGVLYTQGVLSSQVRDGTCAPELRPQKGAKTGGAASPSASVASRDTLIPKGPRASISRSESTRHEHRRSSDLSSRVSFDAEHGNPPTAYSPSNPYMPGSHGKANPAAGYSPSTHHMPGLQGEVNRANEHDERVENQDSGRSLEAVPTRVNQRPHRVQSLDELVTDYSSGLQPPVFRAMESTADFTTNTRKRTYPDDANNDSISPKRVAIDTNTTALYKSSADVMSSRSMQSSDTKPLQADSVHLPVQIKRATGDVHTVGDITRLKNTGLGQVWAPKSASTPQITSQITPRTGDVPSKTKQINAANSHGQNSKLVESDVGKPEQLLTLAEEPDQVSLRLERRLKDLENHQQGFNNLQAQIGVMQTQLVQPSPEAERILVLESQLNDVRSELAQRLPKPVPINTFEAQIKDLRRQLTMRSSEQERVDRLELQLQDLSTQLTVRSSDQDRLSSLESQLEHLTQQLAMRNSEQQRVIRLESLVKELKEQSSQRIAEQHRFSSLELMVKELQNQSTNRFSTQHIYQHVDTQLCDIREHIDQQATTSTVATETQLGLFHEQLRNIQVQLGQRTATPAMAISPRSLDSDSVVSTDVKGFLNALTSEMVKMRSSMKVRIRDMDAAGEPDDDKKYAISDISYELGRVLELAKKRIQAL